MIRIEGLYKYYGAHRAVGPLSAEIADGEVVGLLGLNGAGKTTTLRILACDLLPSAGTVSVGGVDVVESPERVRTMIGYLPDSPPLYDEMNVERFLRFVAELRGVPAEQLDAKVAKALEETALTEVAGDLIASLSHGFRQRVGIAQAIVHEPALVVLDEPSSGLDPVQIKDMRRLVRGISGKRTVLVSSHNLPEISQMCDRLLVIGNGEIVASGTEAELVAKLAAGEQLEVTLRTKPSLDASTLADKLQAIAGVTDVQLRPSREAGEGILTFEVITTGDVRGEVAKVAIRDGGELLSFGRSQRELESVFAKLVSGKALEGDTSEAA
jgi:ABC-2 type transport system ATP-binding protein